MTEIFKKTVSQDGNVSLKSIRVVDEDSLIELLDARKVIDKFGRLHQLFEYVIANAQEYDSCLTTTAQKIAYSDHMFSDFNIETFVFQLTRTVLNFLSSFRTFIDHIERHLKRTYGKESEEIAKLKLATAYEFDSVFAYCFMYKFRNYVQHCGTPPMTHSIHKEYYDDKVNVTFILLLERDTLLSEYKEWGPVKPLLTQQPEKFLLDPLIDDLVKSIFKIYLTFVEINSWDNVLEAQATLLGSIEEDEDYVLDEYSLGEPILKSNGEVELKLLSLPSTKFLVVNTVKKWLSEKNG